MARRPGEGSNTGPGGGTTSRPKVKRKAAPSRPLVLAPGAGYDAKRGRATSPPRSRVFQSELPKPGAQIRQQTRQADRRAGTELAKAPGVRARLKPVPLPPGLTPAEQRRARQLWAQASPAERARATRNAAREEAARKRLILGQTVRGAAGAGLSAADRTALAATGTAPGRALQQAGRVQGASARRQLILSGLLQAHPEITPRQLASVKVANIPRAQRLALERLGLERAGRDVVREGRPDKRIGIGPASVNTTALARTVMAATSLDTGDLGPRQFVKNAGSDVLALGTGPFIGGLQAYRALGKLAQGKPGEAGEIAGETAAAIGQGFVDSVPGYLVRGRFNDALEYGREHPVFSVLDLAAAAGIVGRGAGAFARGAGSNAAAGGARGQLARFGSTVRPAIALTSDPAAIRAGAFKPRRFSMDSIRKGVQVAQDRGREVVRDQHGKPVLVKDGGRMVPVLKPTEKEMARAQRKRANHRASKGNSLERLVRAEAGQELDRAARGGSRVGRKVLKGKDARDLVHLVVTGTVRGTETFREDLLRRAEQIDKALEAGKHRHSGDRKIAETQSAWLRTVAENPKVLAQADRIVEAGHAVAAKLNAGDRALEDARILDPAQGRRARLSEYALAHMDARNVTVREHQALEKAAREAERAAYARVQELPKGRERDAAVAAYRAAHQQRLRVSGRDPQGVIAHERLVAQERVAKEKAGRASAEVESLKARLDRMRGRHQQQRQADKRAVAEGRMDAKTALRRDAKRGRAGAVEKSVRVDRGWDEARLPIEQARVEQHRAALAALPAGAKKAGHLKHADYLEHTRLLKNAEQAVAQHKAALSGGSGPKKAGRVVADGEIGGLMAQLDRATKKARQAEKSLADARTARQGSKLPDTREGIRGPGGEFLSNRAIEQHARAAGRDPETLAYVPHTVGGVGRRAYHQPLRPGTRPRVGSQRRTGEMFRSGVASVGDQVIRDTVVAKRTLVTKAETLDRYIHESGIRLDEASIRELRRGSAHGPLTRAEKRILQRGGYMTNREATELAERMAADGRGNYIPVRAFSAGLDEAAQTALRDRQNPAAMETAHLGMFNSRLLPSEGEAGKARNVVLMPAEELNRMMEHAKPAGEVEKLGNLLNTPFRLAVLPQFRWLAGNFIQPFFLRLPVIGAGINLPGLAMDVRATVKTLHHMERSGNPEWERAAKEIRAELLGGTFIGRRGASNRRTYEDFANQWGERSGAAGAMYAGHVIRNAPFVKQGLDLAVGLLHGFFAMNRVMERFMQMQDLGKSIRMDVREFSGSFAETVRLGKDSLDEIAQGNVGTATQQRYAEKQYETLGKYFGFSPRVRRLIQTIFPFVPWSLNAVRFVFWTMPVHHTIVTAGLLKLSQDLQADWDEQHANLPPGGLKLAIPSSDGGWIDLARYTDYGFSGPLVSGDTSGVVAPLLPQVSGMTNAFLGLDPFNRQLRVKPTADNPEGTPSGLDKVLIGANSAAEALTPYMALIRRLREAGGTPYGDSTILSPKTKPGTDHGSGLSRALNPFRPIYVSAQAPGKAGSVVLSREQKALLREAQHAAGKTTPAQAERERQALLREARFAASGR